MLSPLGSPQKSSITTPLLPQQRGAAQLGVMLDRAWSAQGPDRVGWSPVPVDAFRWMLNSMEQADLQDGTSVALCVVLWRPCEGTQQCVPVSTYHWCVSRSPPHVRVLRPVRAGARGAVHGVRRDGAPPLMVPDDFIWSVMKKFAGLPPLTSTFAVSSRRRCSPLRRRRTPLMLRWTRTGRRRQCMC
eukprot:gene12413-biopygen6444